MTKSWRSEYIQGIDATLKIEKKAQKHSPFLHLATIEVSTQKFHYAISPSNYKEALKEIDLKMNEYMSSYYASLIVDTIKYELLKNDSFMQEAKEYSW